MKIAIATIVLVPALAAADGRHVLVLRSDGGTDAGLRAKVDAQILKLARNLDGAVEAGEITLGDAAAATGCSISEASCRDEVLGTLGADEMIATTIAPGATTKITVRRYAKGSPPRESATMIVAGQAPEAKLAADIGPLFGVKAPIADKTPPPPPPPGPTPVPPPPPTPAISQPQRPVTELPPVTAVAPRTSEPTVTGAAEQPMPGQTDTPSTDHRRLELAGMIGGGGLAVVGVFMWVAAGNTQSDINAITPQQLRTSKDFRHLTDLEATADSYALAGNLMFGAGVALAAVSGYFYWRDRGDHHHAQARITPAVLPHGAGLVLTIGGSP